LQKAIQDRVETPNTTPLGAGYASGWVDYGDPEFDNSALTRWARMDMVDDGGGTYSEGSFQVTCFTLQSTDRLGVYCLAMVNLFLEGMRRSAGRVQCYDWTTPTIPVEVAGKSVLITTGAKHGEPESVAPAVGPDGVHAKAISWAFKILPDDYVGDRFRQAGAS